jgi:hypothetical protein
MVRRTLGEPCRKEKITRASTWREGLAGCPLAIRGGGWLVDVASSSGTPFMRILLPALALAASALSIPALAQDTPEGGAWTDCPVTAVTVMRDRMVVKCGGLAGADNPRMFAIETNDRLLDPVLRVALDAKARGKSIGVLYVKATLASPAGCAPADCRRLVAVESK